MVNQMKSIMLGETVSISGKTLMLCNMTVLELEYRSNMLVNVKYTQINSIVWLLLQIQTQIQYVDDDMESYHHLGRSFYIQWPRIMLSIHLVRGTCHSESACLEVA
jgi:hypothetical protein